MNSMVDSLFDQYERGRMTRRHLVQALAALLLPTSTLAQSATRARAPIVRGLSVDHMDRDAAKRLADKINGELPDAKATDAYQANTGGSTVNLRDPDGFFVQI